MRQKKWLSLLLAAALFASVLPESESIAAAMEPKTVTEVTLSEESGLSAESESIRETETEASEEAGSTEGAEVKEPEVKAPEEPGNTEGTEAEVKAPEEPGSAEEPEVKAPEEPGNIEETEAETPKELGSTEGTEVKAPEEAGSTEGTELEVKTPEEPETTEEPKAEDLEEPKAEAPTGVLEELLDATQTEEGAKAYSLLPLKEVSVSLMLNDYSEEALKKVPVETVLEKLRDSDGNPVEIAADAQLVWSYYKDEDGEPMDDEYHVISRSDTVDLSYAYENSTSYTFELIAGSGKQLDADSIRYIITVYINAIRENLNYTFSKGYKYYHNTISTSSSILSAYGIPVTEVSCYIQPEDMLTEENDEYKLRISSSIASNPNRSDIKVDVYPMQKFLDYKQKKGALEGAITDQILNVGETGAGYPGKYQKPDNANPLASDNLFCMVYSDANTGAVLAYQGLLCIVRSEAREQAKGAFYIFENGSMKAATKTIMLRYGNDSWKLDQKAEADAGMVQYSTEYIGYDFYDGCDNASEYYYALEPNSQIAKVYAGAYDTAAEAEKAKAEDITEQILPSDRNRMPYGYKITAEQYEGNRGNVFFAETRFTIILKNGGALKYSVEAHTRASSSKDLWFEVTGAKDCEEVYQISNSELDSYCGNGYQTLLIKDADVDLSKLAPVFTLAEGAKAYVGTEQKSGESVQDFSKGPVAYNVFIGDQLRNYQVSFVKQTAGAKLFVNGPEKREIFLTNRYDNRHDILIANAGDAALTGLKVELVNASHVKLDDYWTVGGEKNDTLAAFDRTYSDYYGKLSNLAKVRLLPDGDGVISGKLKVSADGQEPVYIELTGYAGNPKITTESLSKGVKFVPYSYVVATNNMYEWNKVTFSIEEGALPKGLKLYPATGEIYGVPQETGKFPITVRADFSREEFDPVRADLTLTVKKNTNKNVYNESDAGYKIKNHIGEESKKGNRDYVLTESGDQLFTSAGEYREFIAFWMNGKKLVEGKDYTKEEGSTKITIREQTFKNKASKDGTNTIAAEFRVGGSTDNELKRTAQNFRMDIGGGSGSGSNGSGGSGSGGSGSGSNSSDSSASGSSGGTAVNRADQISLIVRLTDPSGNPMANMAVELHSTPKTAQTNQNGIAVFAGVEGGHHTLFVKDAGGNILASREFDLQFGASAVIQGDQITAVGGSALTLNVQVEGNVMTFSGVQSGDTYQVLPAGTGDMSVPELWLLLALAACAMGFSALVYRKKRKTV